MKKVDVLFLYETRVRELENICLLKYELERRGYSVGILNTWNEMGRKGRPRYEGKVVVTHAMYHDGIYEFVKSILGKVPKVVNMQCEQIGTMGEKTDPKSRFRLSGIAGQSMNICWGEETVRRLMEECQIDEQHVRKTGQVTLDFCTEQLRGYYMPREALFKEYHIAEGNHVNLFISSFAYVNLPEEIVKQSDTMDKYEFIKMSNESFHEVLDWFKRLLLSTDDQIVIYRPHPAEAQNEVLLRMCDQFPGRFLVIREHSVKQWISVCDKVYTWYSTSAAEAYAFNIPCAILRPREIPQSREVEIFEGARFITEYEAFYHSICNGVTDSLKKEVLDRYYSIEKRMSYQRVADAIEDVYNDDRYLIKYTKNSTQKVGFILRIKQILHGGVILVADHLLPSSALLAKYRTEDRESDYTRQLKKSNFASEEEIAAIQNRIAALLENRSE